MLLLNLDEERRLNVYVCEYDDKLETLVFFYFCSVLKLVFSIVCHSRLGLVVLTVLNYLSNESAKDNNLNSSYLFFLFFYLSLSFFS